PMTPSHLGADTPFPTRPGAWQGPPVRVKKSRSKGWAARPDIPLPEHRNGRGGRAAGGSNHMARRSADPDSNGKSGTIGLRRSDRFLAGLHPADRVVFVSHIQPDPDSLGSMLGLAHLVEHKLGKPTVITQDGLISRAENRAMVEVLGLDLVRVEDVAWDPGDAVVMVDSQPKTGRHTFAEAIPLYAVIDHHDPPGDLDGVPFTDIRASHGATCTLVTKYLREQEVEIPERVATALLYGIESEMAGYPREASAADDAAL